MQNQNMFVVRGTFIDEVVDRPASSRSHSAPRGGPSSSSSLYDRSREHAARLEERYVLTLEARAHLLVPVSGTQNAECFTHCGTKSAGAEATMCTSFTSTQCPTSMVEDCDSMTTGKFSRLSTSLSCDDSWASSSQSTPFFSEMGPGSPGPSPGLSLGVSFGKRDALEPKSPTSESRRPSPEPHAPSTPAPGGKASSCRSIGSVGHPGLCSRRHRELMHRLTFGQRAFLALPMVKRQVAKLGLNGAQELLDLMEAAADKVTWDSRMRREGTSLSSALGALSIRALMTAISKAPDTPDCLKAPQLEEQLERIRSAEATRR